MTTFYPPHGFPSHSLPLFKLGDRVRKTKGSSWQGIVVGTYSTTLTPEGYAVESEREPGSVQIYPAAALELVQQSRAEHWHERNDEACRSDRPAGGGESGT